MKTRIWMIILISLSLIGLVVAEQIFVSNTIDYMKSESDSILQTIQTSENINTAEFVSQIDILDQNWTKKENILCLIINHKDMEKVGEQIQKLRVLITQNKKEEAEYEAELLVYYVDGYEHFVSVTFQNIF